MKKINNISFWIGLAAMGAAVAFTFLDVNNSVALIGNGQYWLIGALVLLIFIASSAILQALESIKREYLQQQGVRISEDEPAEAGQTIPWHRRILRKLTRAAPLEKEEEVAIDHVYDGIRELDNSLPPWWLYGFYISIIWSAVYFVRTIVIDDLPTQEEEYRMEMAAAEQAREEYLKTAGNLIDENNVTMLTASAAIAEGESLYQKHCAVCHQQDGGGAVGPNLTDAYWLHGNSIQEIFSTIKYGVPTKGMISWQDQLNPEEMQKVASFVKLLEGTTPASPKEPQGERMEPGSAVPADSTVAEGQTASL